MTLSYTYDGSAFTYAIAPTSLQLASGAEMGEPVFCGLTPEDPTAALAMKGHRPFVVEESACSQPRLFTGWTTERGVGRGVAAGMFGNATARIHDVTIIDLNALFSFRMISGSDGKRPEETGAQRMAWILASDYLTGLIADTGFITGLPSTMDASDYRGSHPGDVIRDIADRAAGAVNLFAFWDTVAAAVGLWFGPLDEAVSDSTLRISNVAADVDSITTFFPDDDARLSITPTETFSEVTLIYGHDGSGRIFRSRASTATNYIRRGTQITRPWTGKAATATAQAEKFLDEHANEQDRITVTIIVPAASAGLAVAGQRMDVKFSHLTGYTTFTSMRIVNTSLTPTDDTATHYALSLELLAPRAAGTGGDGCTPTLVQSRASRGSTLSSFALTSAPTPGNLLVLSLASSAASPGNEPDLTTGWTRVHRIDAPEKGGLKWLEVWTRTAATGDGASFGLSRGGGAGTVNGVYEVSEWSGGSCGLPSIDDLAYGIVSTTVSETGGHTVTVTVTPTDTRVTVVYATGYSIDTDTPQVTGLTWTGLTEQSEQVFTDDGLAGTASATLSPGAAQSVTITGTGATSPGVVAQTALIVVNLVSGVIDTEVILPPVPGTTILAETPTPAPDGTTVLFTLAGPYLSGSLTVSVDGLPIPSSQVAQGPPVYWPLLGLTSGGADASAGIFGLSWPLDADETITATYITA